VHEPGRRLRRDAKGSFDQPGVGHEEHDDVLGGEIGPQDTGGAGPLHQADQTVERLRAEPFNLRGTRHVHGDQVGYPPIPGLHGGHSLHIGGETMPGVGIGEAGLDGGEVLGHPLGKNGRHQVPAARKAPVEGGIARPGPVGYLIQRGVQTLLGEHLPGGLDYRGTVAGSVGSKFHGWANLAELGNIPHFRYAGQVMTEKIDIPASHADLLEAPNTAVLTTVGADGQPQSTAVWFLIDDDGVLKGSITTDRQKYRNLTRNPRATLFIVDPANPFRTVEIRATVELAPDPDKALLPKFAARYNTPVEVLDAPGSERVVAAFTPVRVVTNG